MLEDLIKMSSALNLSGNSCMSRIWYLEHFISFGIFSINVSGSKIFSSRANARVKVLKTEPSSKTPFVIWFMYFTSLISLRILTL